MSETTPTGRRWLSRSRAHCTSNHEQYKILAIETSCDDTGVAIINENGEILGESLNTQTSIHLKTGGVKPDVAKNLHQTNLPITTAAALNNAGLQLQDLTAVAVTTRPGMAAALFSGVTYAADLCAHLRIPAIPVHHMEAHALTVRMIHKVEFPFLVILASGGHCLLALAQDVDKYLTLGRHLDIAPGDATDKVARFLRLDTLPQCAGLSGGRALELTAQGGDTQFFTLNSPLFRINSCDFSFSGMRTATENWITKCRQELGLAADAPLPAETAAHVCATFQHCLADHLSVRLERAFHYCEINELIPESNRTVVLSGGVGSNLYIRDTLQRVCRLYDAALLCPPPSLCTDNGVMVAWRAHEQVQRHGLRHVTVHHSTLPLAVTPRTPLGDDVREDVRRADIRLKAARARRREQAQAADLAAP